MDELSAFRLVYSQLRISFGLISLISCLSQFYDYNGNLQKKTFSILAVLGKI